MKFTVETAEFKKAMINAEKAIDYKSVLPVLRNIKIEVNNSFCTVYSTNLTQFIKVKTKVINNDADGTFIFYDTKTALKAMKFFNDDTIEFNLNEKGVKVKCGGKKADLLTRKEDYPICPELEKYDTYNYTASEFSNRFNEVKYAVGYDSNRPLTSGIHLSGTDMVVLDGFRMAINSDNKIDIKKPITVPLESMKLCSDTLKGEITINTNNKYIEVKDENTTIISRLMDGEYFDYKKFIPNNTNIVNIDTESFIDGIKYLKSFIGKIRVPIAWRDNKICCLTSDGKFESEVKMSGHFNYDIGFNVDYLLDAIQQFKDKTVDFYMPERNINPLIIKHENSLALVVPMRIREGENPFEETGEVA